MQDFHWTIGETEVRIQTEVQEKAGLRWPHLGLGRTRGSAGPGEALLALCFLGMVRLVLVCCVGCVVPPHTLDFYMQSYSKYMETKQNSAGFENRGVDLC